jgi:hypothetical protein
MTRPWLDEDDTPLIGGDMPPLRTRYEQGRWLARFALRLAVAVVIIIVAAGIVAGSIAMWTGVQG